MTKTHQTNSPTNKTSKASSSTAQKPDDKQQTFNPQTKLDVLIQHAKENPQSLKADDIIHLQRTLGNSAVSRLLPSPPISDGALAANSHIQLKPADINQSHTLNYDDTGKLTNAAAPRSTGLKRPLVINAQLKKGWVTPDTKVKGGHLFKAEFGGVDDETNVVPWQISTEDAFTTFEETYKAAADIDAAQAATTKSPFAATVHTKATFVDRPDLLLSDTELDKEGWPEGKDRDERKAKYADVAERFSGVPTTVNVTVDGLSTTPKPFDIAGAEIAPAFTKNPEAIKTTYVIPERYERNATKPRVFNTITDWKKASKKETPVSDDFERRAKIMHVMGRHAANFGLTAGNGQANLAKLEKKISDFIADAPNQEQILGTYKGEDVFHYLEKAKNRDEKPLWACTNLGGELVAAFTLAPTQYDSLISKGVVK